ncbi:hypothetical protein BS47DRAFT_1336533, partial [Hydnum rufescens UP504]
MVDERIGPNSIIYHHSLSITPVSQSCKAVGACFDRLTQSPILRSTRIEARQVQPSSLSDREPDDPKHLDVSWESPREEYDDISA